MVSATSSSESSCISHKQADNTNKLATSYNLQTTATDLTEQPNTQQPSGQQGTIHQVSEQQNPQQMLGQQNAQQMLGQQNAQQMLGQQNAQQMLGQQNAQQLLGQQNPQQMLGQQPDQNAVYVTTNTTVETRNVQGEDVSQATATVLSRDVNFSNLKADSPMSAFGADAYHSETRKVSSVVVESKVIGDQPDMQDTVRYVEVPTIEEQVKYVTVYEQREVEKRVPKYEIEYVDRVIEVPKIVYKDVRMVARQVVDRFVERKVPYTVERTREVPREVKVPMTRIVDKVVEVPGEVIEVPKYYDVENRIEVPRHVDREVPVVVAQTIKPIITESGRSMAVDVLDYEPQVTTIDVHIAKPVTSALEAVGQSDVRHRLVNITSGQYNTILKQLNGHLDDRMRQCLPYVADGGRVAFVAEQEAHFIVAPDNIEVEGWNRPKAEITNRQVAPSLHSNTYMESQHANRAACCNTRMNKKSTNAQVDVTARGASSSIYHQPSAMQTLTVSGTGTRMGGAQSSHRDASASKSHQRSHMHTEHSGIYTENVGDEQVRQDGSTVLSHRPQQKSRVCC